VFGRPEGYAHAFDSVTSAPQVDLFWYQLKTFLFRNLSAVSTFLAVTQDDCARLKLVRFSSVRRGPTSPTEPSMQLDLMSGTICRRTSDSRTCHTAISDSHKRHFLVSDTNVQCESPLTVLQKFCYLLNDSVLITNEVTTIHNI